VQCERVNDEILIEGRYSDIFRVKVTSNISKTMFKMSKLREEYIQRNNCCIYTVKQNPGKILNALTTEFVDARQT
jgi:hypothetical protein